MKKTAIIILEYNNSEDTINCIKSVIKYNTAPAKFLIIDNGSTKKETIESININLKNIFQKDYKEIDAGTSIERILPDAVLVKNKSNIGYAQGNNIGLDLTYNDPEIENVLILNSDILFVEDIIPTLLKDLASNTAIVSPLLYKLGLKDIDYNCARKALSVNQIISLHIPFPNDPFGILRKRKIPIKANTGLLQIELPSGSCMLARKELFKDIQGFDKNTFLYYEEDILWEKLKNKGLCNYIDTNLKCIHLGATSTKKSSSRFIVNTSVKSAIYLMNTYHHPNLMQKGLIKLFRCMIDQRMRLIEFFRNKHSHK